MARRAAAFGIAARTVVATDSEEIACAVATAGVEAVLTRADHRTGTDRIAEVVRRPEYAWADVVLNLQGDDPFVSERAARDVVALVRDGAGLATAAAPLDRRAAPDPNRVKVVVDGRGWALRFTRDPAASGPSDGDAETLLHLGVYAYARAALLAWAALPATDAERVEGLEQLRPMAHGWRIAVARVPAPEGPSVDTAADLAAVEALMRERLVQGAAR